MICILFFGYVAEIVFQAYLHCLHIVGYNERIFKWVCIENNSAVWSEHLWPAITWAQCVPPTYLWLDTMLNSVKTH